MKSKFRFYIFIWYVCSIIEFPLKATVDEVSPSTSSAPVSQASIVSRQVVIERKIGLEIETSALKVALNQEKNLYSGFLIKSKAGTPLWSIEQDTLDRVFKEDKDEHYQYNIEFKTRGGFGDPLIFLQTLHTMTEILKKIKESASPGYRLSVFHLNSLLQECGYEYSGIEKVNNEQAKFLIKRNDSIAAKVRPQITYQLPMSEIPRVFERLRDLKHPIRAFLNCLDNVKFKPYRLPLKEEWTEEPPKLVNLYKSSNILNLLFENFSSSSTLSLSNTKISAEAKGFTYLFLSYWAYLFNGNVLIKKSEPGLKLFLPIMSRIPFSQLYDSGLSENQKEEFKSLVAKIIEEHGTYQLRHYYNYKNKPIKKRKLTLKLWYLSIINEEYRKLATIESSANQWVECKVDLLSPPPNMPEGYAMGRFSWDCIKSPLIEVRAYASLFSDKGGPNTIEGVEDYVTKETEWFFDITLKKKNSTETSSSKDAGSAHKEAQIQAVNDRVTTIYPEGREQDERKSSTLDLCEQYVLQLTKLVNQTESFNRVLDTAPSHFKEEILRQLVARGYLNEDTSKEK